MSRKKGARRKMKVGDSYSRHSPNSPNVNQSIPSEEYLPDTEQTGQDLPVHSTAHQTSFNQHNLSMPTPLDQQNATDNIMSSVVRVKTESNVELEHQTSANENKTQPRSIPTSKQDITNHIKPAKIKRERLSLDSSFSSRSTHHFSTPTVDLGSQLEQSLSTLKSGPDLTWCQLLEAKNLPKVHIPERVVIKTEKSDSGSDIMLCSTDDDTENDRLGFRREATLQSSNALPGKEKPGHSLPGFGLTGSSNRFSKNHDGGSGVLDLSKKAIPPEIRRVLASKYGVAKRHEEGQLGGVVPNFNKSRSRFTLSSKKTGVTDSEDENYNRPETSESGHLSTTDVRQGSKMKRSHIAPTSTSSFQKSTANSAVTKSRSVSPTDCSGSIPLPARLLNRRRFSSSTYEGKRSDQFIDRHEGVTDKLQSRGLVDLGSHYVSLLKDSPPPLTGRNSRSPHKEPANENSTLLDKRKGNAAPKTGGLSISKGLPQAARRSSFTGDSAENSRLLGEMLGHDGGKDLNETRSLSATGRNSKSPVDAESHNPEATMICLGETTRLGPLRDPLHSSRSSSR